MRKSRKKREEKGVQEGIYSNESRDGVRLGVIRMVKMALTNRTTVPFRRYEREGMSRTIVQEG